MRGRAKPDYTTPRKLEKEREILEKIARFGDMEARRAASGSLRRGPARSRGRDPSPRTRGLPPAPSAAEPREVVSRRISACITLPEPKTP